ncbi:hypothetical protein L3049_06155 [Labilibaculum sp. DW002]|uniref:DNA binding HTH domain-containing protein n=1 Tax=Paralabilibaculum antarcticum TaxID=2912572 RepID=A0ABT5VQM9_9BACT|nr:helix-turn-helix domain-containing protein [Labilibaculum sp. DW002]MDE5417586.1 hypothetical protein [Labilibaculum sp. DW002]
MEYRTMNRKELAMELDISISTLGRRMKKLNPVFLEHIKGHYLLLENEVKYIHENVEWRTKWEIGILERK